MAGTNPQEISSQDHLSELAGGNLTAKEIATFEMLEKVLDGVKRTPKTPPLVTTVSTQPPNSDTKMFSDVHPTTARKLVTVRCITSLKRIVGTEKNLALLDDWQVVVDRDANFAAGELVVFCQADTFLPESTFKGFRDVVGVKVKVTNWKNERGYNLPTRTIRKHVSQGLIFHLDDFPVIKADVEKPQGAPKHEPSEQKDYADLLGVKSWVLKDGKVPVPTWIRTCSTPPLEILTSIDSVPMLQGAMHQESLLMDGNQMTCYLVRRESRLFNSVPELSKLDPNSRCDSGCFGVCGPSCDLRFRPADIYWQVALHYGLKNKLETVGKSVAVTGELVGSTIKGNPYGYAKGEHEFLVYDVFDIDAQERWAPKAVQAFVESNGLEHVPIRGYYVIPKIARDNEDLFVRANLQAGTKGLVFKNVDNGKWFKVKSQRYCLGACGL